MRTLRIHPGDTVAIALEALPAGTAISDSDNTQARNDIPAMHKIALAPIAAGEPVIKCGTFIGIASADIAAGDHVHTHNCAYADPVAYADTTTPAHSTAVSKTGDNETFNGYRRDNGRTGTRNYIGVITSVNCSATVAKQIASQAERSGLLDEFGNIDGVVAITHNTGCGMQSSGQGFDLLKRTLDGYIGHPNFGGVLVVGLGCEIMQVEALAEGSGTRMLGIQEAGGTRAAIEQGLALVRELATAANHCERTTTPLSELTVALQCGGSDAYSAITANPALGVAVDKLIANGGSAILAETPEIFGAEHLLTARAVSASVAERLLERVAWWRQHAEKDGSSLNSNPSPGNLAGGITTILEKSLGAQAKGGGSTLNAVIDYAEKQSAKGLNFMDSPGFDPASVTGQVAAGANVICFTTGRGSVFGFKPVPSIKLATNTALFEHMRDDMDINCGGIAELTETTEECGQRIYREIIDVASGKQPRSEELGYGDAEFTPWQLGSVY